MSFLLVAASQGLDVEIRALLVRVTLPVACSLPHFKPVCMLESLSLGAPKVKYTFNNKSFTGKLTEVTQVLGKRCGTTVQRASQSVLLTLLQCSMLRAEAFVR